MPNAHSSQYLVWYLLQSLTVTANRNNRDGLFNDPVCPQFGGLPMIP
jgi:hypothetical protein